MKTTDPIHVSFVTNDQFAQHLGAAIASLLLNASSDERINIYVLQQNLSHSNRHKLVQLEKLHPNTHIHLLKVDGSKFMFLPSTHKRTIETYFRLELPTILPAIDKLIYLDADVIVMDNIKKLWDQEIGDNILLAVEEPKYLHKDRLENLGMKGSSPYFNAGVLLMDLKKMRTFGLKQKVLTYVSKKFRFLKAQDQDIFNALFENRWRALPLAFNAYGYLCHKRREDEFIIYTKKDVTSAEKNPCIIHFNLYPKPWHPLCTDTRRKRYWEYLKKTNFEVRKPGFEMSLKVFLAQNIPFITNNGFLRNSRLLSKIWGIFWKPIRRTCSKKVK